MNQHIDDNNIHQQYSIPDYGKQLIPIIVERLKQIKPKKIILFGSYAYGVPSANSDIDLLVVTNSNALPKSYKEKSDLYVMVSKNIRDLKQQISIDLIVQTKSMHQLFIENGSLFSKEIAQKGKILYETDNKRMA